MGVVIRRWVWLECIAVISGCFCKEHLILLISTPLVLALFAAASLFVCSFK